MCILNNCLHIRIFFYLSVFLFTTTSFSQNIEERDFTKLIHTAYSTNYKADGYSINFRFFVHKDSVSRKSIWKYINGKQIDSTKADKFYFSEKYFILYNQNGEQKKNIDYSNESGSTEYTLTIDHLLNLNQKHIKIKNRGFYSPFHTKTIEKYDFVKDTTSSDDEQRIYIIPKNKTLFLFNGIITLSKDGSVLKSINLYAANCKMANADSIAVQLNFNTIGGSFPVIVEQKITYVSEFYNTKSKGYSVIDLSNHEIGNYKSPNLKTNEIQLLDYPFYGDKKTDNSCYPEAEVLEEKITENKNKTPTKNSKIDAEEIFLTGYYFFGKQNKTSYYFSQIPYFVQFDAYQGWSLYQKAEIKFFLKKSKSLSIDNRMRYSISREKFYGKTKLTYLLFPKKQFQVFAAGGSYTKEFTGKDPFNLSFWKLYFPESISASKVFNNKFVNVGVHTEIVNGFYFSPDFLFERRTDLPKIEDFPFAYNPRNKIYIENFLFPTHNISKISLSFKYVFNQKFFYLKEKKEVVSNYSPKLGMKYEKAVKNIFNSSIDFSRISGSIEQELPPQSFGIFTYKIQGQKMISYANIERMDFNHIQTSRSIIYDEKNLDNPFLLDYFELDNKDYTMQLDIINDFNSILTSKIPLAKKYKCNITTEFHQVFFPKGSYSELVIGMNHIFSLIKLNYGIGILDNKIRQGIRIGFLFNKPKRL